MLKALVIQADRGKDLTDLVAIAKALAYQRHGRQSKVSVKAVLYVSQLDCFVALYECSGALGVEGRRRSRR